MTVVHAELERVVIRVMPMLVGCGFAAACASSEPVSDHHTAVSQSLELANEVFVWTRADLVPHFRSAQGMAYDASRRRTVLFGGSFSSGQNLNDTWEWDGVSWTDKTPIGVSPPAREQNVLSYDAARRRVVLFGGLNKYNVRLRDTWEWDGFAWSNLTPASGGPEARWAPAMAYDSVRARTVLVGGYRPQGTSCDTWEWDGSTWVDKTPALVPPIRQGHAIAFDTTRGKLVLFGGIGNFATGSFGADTWEWDGATWEEKTPSSSPPGRYKHALSFDSARARVVLMGGRNAGGTLNDTWEWDGTSWSNRTPVTESPSARENHSLAYDAFRGCTVLFGATNPSDTWEWDGTTWSNRSSAAKPHGSLGESLTYDSARQRMVVFGGGPATTWELDGSSWSNRTPASGPSQREGARLAYDESTQRSVLFGGRSPDTVYLQDTWEWDGATWIERSPASGNPPPRFWHSTTYDSVRQRVLLFGGFGPNNLRSNDLWEWNGTVWTDRTPAAGGPVGRVGAAFGYDPLRKRAVLFGGAGASADTWEWDGVQWTDKTPASSNPPQRGFAKLVFNPIRGRLTLFGGAFASVPLQDLWEWDGAEWVERTPTNSPPERTEHGFVFDAARQRFVLFGGYAELASYVSDLWFLSMRGGACTSAADSTTGMCTDGVSCESSACGTCESCNGSERPGQCAPVRFDEDPDSCSLAQGRTCDANGQCKAALGVSVQDPRECASGYLVDGVCCDSPSCGPCQTCNAAEKEIADNAGRCGTQRAGTDKKDDCAIDDVASCGHNGFCDGRGLCQNYPTGTACGVAFCAGSVLTARMCTGAGSLDATAGCIAVSQGQDCAPYACDAEQGCKTRCADDTDCISSYRCVASACVSKEAASCDGEHTLIAPNGTRTDCAPYRCSGSSCRSTCASIADCVEPNVCNENNECIAPSVEQSIADGCGCRSTPHTRVFWPSLLIVTLVIARRRRVAARSS